MRGTGLTKGLLLAAGAVTVLSCAPVLRQPLELDQNLAWTGVRGPVVVMKVADLRTEQFDLVGMGLDVHKAAMRLLPAKGYEVMSYRTEVAASTEAGGGMGVRLYISIEEAAVETGERGRGYRVRVSGRLAGGDSVLWRDSAEGRSGLSGLLALLSRPSSRYEAAHEAVADLLDTLPAQIRSGENLSG